MSLNRNPDPRWARVRRAERYFLRWAAPSAPLSDPEAAAITRCRITPEADNDLRLLLECKGSWQGGPLYGLRNNGELSIQMARSGLPRTLHPGNDPYGLNPSYMLGLSDMLSPMQLDWRAHWIAAPDSLTPDDITRQADEGFKRGLVDDVHPLIVVGDERDGLHYWGLVRDIKANTWRELTVLRP